MAQPRRCSSVLLPPELRPAPGHADHTLWSGYIQTRDHPRGGEPSSKQSPSASRRSPSASKHRRAGSSTHPGNHPPHQANTCSTGPTRTPPCLIAITRLANTRPPPTTTPATCDNATTPKSRCIVAGGGHKIPPTIARAPGAAGKINRYTRSDVALANMGRGRSVNSGPRQYERSNARSIKWRIPPVSVQSPAKGRRPPADHRPCAANPFYQHLSALYRGGMTVGHGTRSAYKAGCRCAACKESHRVYQRGYRERVLAGDPAGRGGNPFGSPCPAGWAWACGVSGGARARGFVGGPTTASHRCGRGRAGPGAGRQDSVAEAFGGREAGRVVGWVAEGFYAFYWRRAEVGSGDDKARQRRLIAPQTNERPTPGVMGVGRHPVV